MRGDCTHELEFAFDLEVVAGGRFGGEGLVQGEHFGAEGVLVRWARELARPVFRRPAWRRTLSSASCHDSGWMGVLTYDLVLLHVRELHLAVHAEELGFAQHHVHAVDGSDGEVVTGAIE